MIFMLTTLEELISIVNDYVDIYSSVVPGPSYFMMDELDNNCEKVLIDLRLLNIPGYIFKDLLYTTKLKEILVSHTPSIIDYNYVICIHPFEPDRLARIKWGGVEDLVYHVNKRATIITSSTLNLYTK